MLISENIYHELLEKGIEKKKFREFLYDNNEFLEHSL